MLDENNPDWLPTLNLGHSSLTESTARAAEERWERVREREARRNAACEVVSEVENGDKQVDAGVQTTLTSKSIDEGVDYFQHKIRSLMEIDKLGDMHPFYKY